MSEPLPYIDVRDVYYTFKGHFSERLFNGEVISLERFATFKKERKNLRKKWSGWAIPFIEKHDPTYPMFHQKKCTNEATVSILHVQPLWKLLLITIYLCNDLSGIKKVRIDFTVPVALKNIVIRAMF